MKKYQEMTREELLVEKEALEKQFEEIKAMNLKLDMSRGKPSAEQLDISMDILDVLDSKSVIKGENGMDLRNYGVGAQIITDLGFNNFNLITNNPKKIIGLKGYGLTINENINLQSEVNKYNERYINTKREKMHHLM